MILTAIFVGLSFLALALVLFAAKGRSQPVTKLEDLAGKTRPVDIEAFRNLIDPDEEEFLQANLSGAAFRAVQRERLRAALDYVGCATHNAAVLLRLGEAALRSPDPEIARAGQQLVDSALRLRLYASLCMLKLWVGIALPEAHLSPGRLLDSYQHLRGLASHLALMQQPARATLLNAVL